MAHQLLICREARCQTQVDSKRSIKSEVCGVQQRFEIAYLLSMLAEGGPGYFRWISILYFSDENPITSQVIETEELQPHTTGIYICLTSKCTISCGKRSNWPDNFYISTRSNILELWVVQDYCSTCYICSTYIKLWMI